MQREVKSRTWRSGYMIEFEVIKLAPDDAEAYFNRGNAYADTELV
ncbi:tetratricopeptide repeat protein [Breznakiellaceae bacterium SP9]